jgi:hypothetical protein
MHDIRGKRREGMRTIRTLRITTTCAYLLAWGQLAQADTALLGNMQADRILFLGNSICLAPPGGTWPNNWGASASARDKDYVHLLTNKIEAATGGSLAIAPPSVDYVRWYYGNPLLNWDGNIINVADYFERNYNTWDNARIQNQLDLHANIVVLQFGENMGGGTLTQFSSALKSMLTALKNSSNPNIFVTSGILGTDTNVDAIKRQLCGEDPTHRVFVDLSTIWANASTHGDYDHPNDAGMALVANTLFDAMVVHAVPEPNSIVLLGAAAIGLCAYAWKRRSGKCSYKVEEAVCRTR